MVTSVIERLMDYENSKLPFTHDIYLKAFARLCKISDQYDYLIIDEAQDLNPVLIDIVQKANRPAMVVGDHFQSIYGFRGAENAMDCFEGQVLPLSQSFRFGPKIAQVANQILRQSLTRPTTTLLGFESQQSSVFEYQGKVKQRSTLLARTNYRLFEGLVQIKLPFHFIGGIDEMINQVSAGYALYKGVRPQISDPTVSRFATWEDCKEASELEDEPDLVRLVRIVEQYTDAIPEILEGMRARHCPDPTRALIIVGTGHKAKGLEYDHVIILDDFLTPSQLRGMLSRKRITAREYSQEINLLYVVNTRAKVTLSISQPLFDEIAGGQGLSDQLFDPM
jgi:superfamily I DNA/RNA helicase